MGVASWAAVRRSSVVLTQSSDHLKQCNIGELCIGSSLLSSCTCYPEMITARDQIWPLFKDEQMNNHRQ
jgi:hypothetical protein